MAGGPSRRPFIHDGWGSRRRVTCQRMDGRRMHGPLSLSLSLCVLCVRLPCLALSCRVSTQPDHRSGERGPGIADSTKPHPSPGPLHATGGFWHHEVQGSSCCPTERAQSPPANKPRFPFDMGPRGPVDPPGSGITITASPLSVGPRCAVLGAQMQAPASPFFTSMYFVVLGRVLYLL